MKSVIQVVKKCKVVVDEIVVGEINRGLLVLFGVSNEDTIEDVKKLSEKILKLRIFVDDNDKLNKSVLDINGEILVVSNFTLLADTTSNRPGFSRAGKPEHAKAMYEKLISFFSEKVTVASGKFGADMKIHQVLDGPITILL